MKTLILSFFLIVDATFANAQNYAYTYAKIPFLEYIGLILNGKNGDNNREIGGPVDGVFINTGYAFKIKPNIYLETGVDYLLVNRNKYVYVSRANPYLENDILEIENSVLAFQLRPLWRRDISADNNAFFFAALGFNFQKLFSNASFSTYKMGNNNQQVASIEQTKSKSNFYWATQPEIGVEFRNERNLGFRFGVSYSYINWNTSESKLKFVNNPNLEIELHKTSNLFFSFGFVY